MLTSQPGRTVLVKLYNTLNRCVETFQPADPARVTLYVCGPTVYNYIHIGNARTFLVFDLLARTLKRRYPNVVYARNVTDIDDKINTAARELGSPITTVTSRFDTAFIEDMAGLGLLVPDVVPYATAHIKQIIAMIERLIASGHAYVADGHVLFSVGSFPDYGKLSRRDPNDMLAGARIDVAPYKRDPGDFVLWKPSDDTLPGWDSPWGRGRPGWHIECSAMAEAHLGETIDIHGGGMDLQFPHHENEIAQSECAHGGHRFARYWMHGGMLNLGGSKMSKSLGNTFRVHDLLQEVPAEALRYALLSGHYRQPLDWTDGLIEQSVRTLDRLYGTLRDLGDVHEDANDAAIPQAIEDALDDDLDTPRVLAEIAGIAAAARKATSIEERSAHKIALLGAGRALGMLQMQPEAWFARGADDSDDTRIQSLVDERNAAKTARDFSRADAIRNALADEGILLEDTAQGVRWVRRRV
ncbi:MAG: cysteine--tRNA ligase [Lysobacteraceae bacterium]